MKFKSQYFQNLADAMSVADRLIIDDSIPASDRQKVGSFYNGRETMTEDEAEEMNVGNIVNHLFGYNNIDRLRSQLSSIVSTNDATWAIRVTDPRIDVATRDEISYALTEEMTKRMRRQRRLTPQWHAAAGNLILHGRDVMVFTDQFDWCPKSGFLYVSGDSQPSRETLPYAFMPTDLPYNELVSYLELSQKGKSSGWNKKALQDAVGSLKPGTVTMPLVRRPITDERTAEHENINSGVDYHTTQVNTRSTLPVWYLFEVDHTKPAKPVSLKIIARYSLLKTADTVGVENDKTDEKEYLLYENKNHFKSVRNWLVPFFADTEIGGQPLWNSTVGIGKLNYPRDADVEEFFNLAMDGAKDAMRAKWKVLDGASREKIQRYFSDRQDILPEGLEPIKVETAGNYQHAFTVIQMLSQLSAADSAGPVSNIGKDNDELEIQAVERQNSGASLIASRMNDIYDSLDDMGTEIVRRFMASPISENHVGFGEVDMFRSAMEARQVPRAALKALAESKHGEMLHIEVRTIRAVGDGSRANEAAGVTQLMQSLGTFGPEAQELIKRRFVTVITRDSDFAKTLVPFEQRQDPDQLARARNENYSAMSRGVIGFVPELNADDVHLIHAPEHVQEMQAANAKSQEAGGMDNTVFAGIKSLGTHTMLHVNQLRGNPSTAEQGNNLLQEMEKISSTADGLNKAFLNNQKSDDLSEAEKVKFQQKNRDQDFKDRQQAALEMERDRKHQLDAEAGAVSGATAISDSAVKAAGVTQGTPPEPEPAPL